jgi:hypothetical protein
VYVTPPHLGRGIRQADPFGGPKGSAQRLS